MPATVFHTENAEQTHKFGASLGRLLRPGDVVLLHGDLGAGKTTLTQGIALGLGVRESIQSPTFTLVAEHAGETSDGEPITLYHLDLYRLAGEEDLDSFGWEQYLAPTDGITVVEWPERAGSWLPEVYLLIHMELVGQDRRRMTIEPIPANGRPASLLSDLQSIM